MDSTSSICITAGLARENGALKTVEHEGSFHYVAEMKDYDKVLESRLIPVYTDSGLIKSFLTEWAAERERIMRYALSSVSVRLS